MMNGKTVIVTGANSGIGRATTAAIVKLRGRVIMACRDTSNAEEAAEEIRQQTGVNGTQLVVRELDLASLTSIRAFCQRIIKVTTVISFFKLNITSTQTSFKMGALFTRDHDHLKTIITTK